MGTFSVISETLRPVVEFWRSIVVINSALLVGALVRLHLERAGKRPKRIEKKPSPALALVMIGGVVYITMDVLANLGDDHFSWHETPLATVVIVTSTIILIKSFRESESSAH